MATKQEKTERRWKVVKGILIYIAAYGVLLICLHLYGISITELDMLTGALFGSGVIGIVGNWVSKPVDDDSKD